MLVLKLRGPPPCPCDSCLGPESRAGVPRHATGSREEEHKEHPRSLFWTLTLSVSQSSLHALEFFCLSLSPLLPAQPSIFLIPSSINVSYEIGIHVLQYLHSYKGEPEWGMRNKEGALIPRTEDVAGVKEKPLSWEAVVEVTPQPWPSSVPICSHLQ